MTSRPASDLLTLLGEPAFVALAEEFGGTRLYVPKKLTPDHEIVQAIGADAAQLLSDRVAPDWVKVPLARYQRARHYLGQNMSNARIARRLGITERGVERLLASRGEPRDTAKPLPLFPDA